jgi:uncharacterized damage-inducible protein DinB
MTKGQLLAGQYRINLGVFKTILDDLSEKDSRQCGENNANPIKWLVGHLSYYSSYVLQLLGAPAEYDPSWRELFRSGTEVDIDDDKYPPFDQVRTKLAELDGKIIDRLDAISDEELEKKLPEDSAFFKGSPIASVVLFLVNHEFYHGGQITTIRTKVLGKEQPFG